MYYFLGHLCTLKLKRYDKMSLKNSEFVKKSSENTLKVEF